MAARRRKRKPARDQAPGWVWMAFGLGLGLLVALGVYVRLQPAAGPAPARPQAASPAPTRAEPEPAPKPEPAAEATPPDAAADDDDENRFDFYEVLPRFEVVIPEVEKAEPNDASQPIEEPGSYVLQVGSFRALKDADRMKASLALLGIESRIQRVAVDDETFHRVRIGPSSDLAEINRIRRRLREARIDSLVMRVR
jgi:cell division protein FtsN